MLSELPNTSLPSVTAVRIYFRDGRRSLVRCFDEVVASCLESAIVDLAPALDVHG